MCVVKKLALMVAVWMCAATAAAVEMNVAVVNVQKAIADSEEYKALATQAKSEFGPDETAIKALGTEIQTLTDKFTKDSEVMSDAEKRRQQKEIEDKQLDYQFRVNKLQKTAQDRQQEILGQMGPKVEAVLRDLIDAEKYDLILARQSVIHADAKFDITAKVTELLNQKK